MADADPHPVFVAIEPLLAIVGGEVLAPGDLTTGDIAIEWEGEAIGGIRLGSLTDALDRMVGHLEAELGAPLDQLSRTAKQRAVHMLDEQGAFLLRKSIDDIADRMGVSRITVYNYLSQSRRHVTTAPTATATRGQAASAQGESDHPPRT
jgi:predicted DNA-binding protein (UPF0251 family)